MANQRPPNLFKDSNHPLAGRIIAGVKTTLTPERRPRVSMQLPEMYIPTMEDYAGQMFSERDPVGTRVYYCESGTFNTVDEMGRAISFIGGLFKTEDREIKRFLQYFVDLGHIKYLQLGEDSGKTRLQPIHDSSSEGSKSSYVKSDEPNQQEPSNRKEPAPEPVGSGTGGETAGDSEQQAGGTTVSSSDRDRDDRSEQERNEPSGEPSQENPIEAPMSPLERLRAKATG